MSVAAVLRDPPAYLHTAEVAVIVLAVPGYGPKRVEKLLADHMLAPDRDDRRTVGPLASCARGELRALTPRPATSPTR